MVASSCNVLKIKCTLKWMGPTWNWFVTQWWVLTYSWRNTLLDNACNKPSCPLCSHGKSLSLAFPNLSYLLSFQILLLHDSIRQELLKVCSHRTKGKYSLILLYGRGLIFIKWFNPIPKIDGKLRVHNTTSKSYSQASGNDGFTSLNAKCFTDTPENIASSRFLGCYCWPWKG